MSFAEDESRHYEEKFKAGRTGVTVRAGECVAEALDMLRRNGGQRYQGADTMRS